MIEEIIVIVGIDLLLFIMGFWLGMITFGDKRK